MTNSLSLSVCLLLSLMAGASLLRTSLQYTEAFIDIAARWKERAIREWNERGESIAGDVGSLRLLLLHFHLVTVSRFDTLYKLSNVKLFASPSHSPRYTHRSDPLA